MTVEVLDYGYAGRLSGPARPSLWRRAVDCVRSLGVSYELDSHLAEDIGAKRYTVPVFVRARDGEWR